MDYDRPHTAFALQYYFLHVKLPTNRISKKHKFKYSDFFGQRAEYFRTQIFILNYL